MSGRPPHPVGPIHQPGHPVPPGAEPPAFHKKSKLFHHVPGIPTQVTPGSIRSGKGILGVEDLRSMTVTTCRLTLQGSQSIADSTSTSIVPGSALADQESMWDGTHAYVTIPWPATWQVSFNVRYAGDGTGYRQASVFKSTDGGSTFTNVTKSQVNDGSPSGSIGTTLGITYLDAYNRGDLLRVMTFQTSTGALNVVQFDWQIAYRGGK